MQLPTELFRHILEQLPENEQALGGRLVCKLAAQLLSQAHQRTVQFSLPLPPWFQPCQWAQQWQEGMRLLTLGRKLQLLSTAAASGSEANMEHAWALVQPCLFPELIPHSEVQNGMPGMSYGWGDLGSAAARAGHVHLLPWLLQHGCPLSPSDTLKAAAQHSDLAALQSAWQLLIPRMVEMGAVDHPKPAVVCAACESGRPDAREKVAWLLDQAPGAGFVPASGDERQKLLLEAATGAARAGDVPLLRWLTEVQGLDLPGAPPGEPGHGTARVLCRALCAPDLAAAEWLVGEVGGALPMPAGDLVFVWMVAAIHGDVTKLRWLVERGLPVHSICLLRAAECGHLDEVRYLHEECGQALDEVVVRTAVWSGSIPLVEWLLDSGCITSAQAYDVAAQFGKVEVLWSLEGRGCTCQRDGPGVVLPRPDMAQVRPTHVQAVRRLLECESSSEWRRVLDVVQVQRWALQLGALDLARFVSPMVAQEHGALVAPGALDAAADSGCEAAVDLVLELGGQRALQNEYGRNPYAAAGRHGDLATLRYLRRIGVPWGRSVLREAVDRGAELPVLRWMVEQGAPWDSGAVHKASVRSNRSGMFKESRAWLVARGQEAWHVSAMAAVRAAGGACVELLLWLLSWTGRR